MKSGVLFWCKTCKKKNITIHVQSQQVNLYINPDEEQYILSEGWGSFFYHEEEDPKHDKHMNTYWGRIISRYNAIAVPTVEYIAGKLSV